MVLINEEMTGKNKGYSMEFSTCPRYGIYHQSSASTPSQATTPDTLKAAAIHALTLAFPGHEAAVQAVQAVHVSRWGPAGPGQVWIDSHAYILTLIPLLSCCDSCLRILFLFPLSSNHLFPCAV